MHIFSIGNDDGANEIDLRMRRIFKYINTLEAVIIIIAVQMVQLNTGSRNYVKQTCIRIYDELFLVGFWLHGFYV